jgi:hypothetical protein
LYFWKPFIRTQLVNNPTRPSVSAAGTECCVVVRQLTLRSVHRESVGRAMEPRKSAMRELTLFQMRKATFWREATLRQSPAGVGEHGMQTWGSFRNLGGPTVSAWRVRVGKPENNPLVHVG